MAKHKLTQAQIAIMKWMGRLPGCLVCMGEHHKPGSKRLDACLSVALAHADELNAARKLGESIFRAWKKSGRP